MFEFEFQNAYPITIPLFFHDHGDPSVGIRSRTVELVAKLITKNTYEIDITPLDCYVEKTEIVEIPGNIASHDVNQFVQKELNDSFEPDWVVYLDKKEIRW